MLDIKQFLLKIYIKKNIIAILMKTGQRCLFSVKTVGRVKYRDRLVHRWVSVMMLNVQSKSFFIIISNEAQGIIFVLEILRVLLKSKIITNKIIKYEYTIFCLFVVCVCLCFIFVYLIS